MKALMGDHKSKEAAQIVENYLKSHPDYPDNLRNKVLEASWILMKQMPYVAPPKPAAAPTKATTPAKKAAPAKKATSTKKATPAKKATTTKKK